MEVYDARARTRRWTIRAGSEPETAMNPTTRPANGGTAADTPAAPAPADTQADEPTAHRLTRCCARARSP